MFHRHDKLPEGFIASPFVAIPIWNPHEANRDFVVEFHHIEPWRTKDDEPGRSFLKIADLFVDG